MGWRKLESDYATDCSFPHPSCHGLEGADWHHRPGCEWLAANLIVAPGLAALLRLAVSGDNTSPKDDPHGRSGSKDPYSRLPHEITDAIIELLSPIKFTALRVAGCSGFLAIEGWNQLLREVMSRLWKVWDATLPSF